MSLLTTALFGGLGNQMFQYAMGRAFSVRNGVPLGLDLCAFDFDKLYKRKYELHHFQIPGDVRMEYRLTLFMLSRVIRRMPATSSLISVLMRRAMIVESSRGFDEEKLFCKSARPVYMMGYWQDERYFSDINEIIKQDFTLAANLSKANWRIAERLRDANAVAIHIRRLHEMATKPGAAPISNAEKVGQVLSGNYYDRALQAVLERVNRPLFCVFSDFPQWAQQNLKLHENSIFLDNDRGPDYEDMILMSMCRHHIIANSSFSWWGAWLGRHNSQVVIAPRKAKHIPGIPSYWTQI
jgi:hypothetical protein